MTFPLKFCGVDDAVRLLTGYGPGALMGKLDINNAFRLIPVRSAEWHLLGYKCEKSSTLILFYHLAAALHRISFDFFRDSTVDCSQRIATPAHFSLHGRFFDRAPTQLGSMRRRNAHRSARFRCLGRTARRRQNREPFLRNGFPGHTFELLPPNNLPAKR